MAVDWLNDLTKVMDAATGVVKQVTAVVTPPTTTATPPVGETTPKQAAIADSEAKPSAVPWGLLLGGLLLYALLEW
jgi:hypothetical protein